MRIFLFPLRFIFCLLILLVIIGCQNPIDNPAGNISGNILLEDQLDYSGIAVSIYNLAKLDTKIVDINTEYPHIGVIINQQTQFDHRFQTPVKTALTNEDGDFKVQNIPVGVYNIVISKDNYGFKYVYNVPIIEGNNQLDEYYTLYQEIHLSGDSFDDITFEFDHHYIIDDDYNIYNADVIIEPNSIIRIEPGKSINLSLCEILAQSKHDSLFWITSNDGFEQYTSRKDRDDIGYFQSFITYNGTVIIDNMINWGKIDFANIGFENHIDGLIVSNMIFRNSLCGFQSSNLNTTNCEDVLCYDVTSDTYGGIYFLDVSNGYIRKSIFVNSHNGILVKHSFLGNVNNNYFYSNNVGLSVWSTECKIEHNEFKNNYNRDLDFVGNNDSVSGEGELEIYYNNFNSENGIVQWSPSGSYSVPSQIVINNNNFENNSHFIKYASGHINFIIDARYNYFNGFDSENAITQRLSDLTGQDLNFDEIDISNFRINLIEDSGIEEE